MYENQGRWEEAEELEVQVMETHKRAWRGASFHTDQHEQSCVRMERPRLGQEAITLIKGSVQLRERAP